MKLKIFLKGFGSGVLFATMILAIALLFRPENKVELTDREIMERARELGMETVGAGENETTSEAPSENVPVVTEKLTEPETEMNGETEEEKDSAPSAEDILSDGDNTRVVIEIVSGMSAETVSQILQEAEVVDSSVDFSSYLMSEGKSRYIRSGTYELSRGMSFEDIAEVICASEQ